MKYTSLQLHYHVVIIATNIHSSVIVQCDPKLFQEACLYLGHLLPLGIEYRNVRGIHFTHEAVSSPVDGYPCRLYQVTVHSDVRSFVTEHLDGTALTCRYVYVPLGIHGNAVRAMEPRVAPRDGTRYRLHKVPRLVEYEDRVLAISSYDPAPVVYAHTCGLPLSKRLQHLPPEGHLLDPVIELVRHVHHVSIYGNPLRTAELTLTAADSTYGEPLVACLVQDVDQVTGDVKVSIFPHGDKVWGPDGVAL